jgi:uncharacterized protein YndB with AHSA1/START domain
MTATIESIPVRRTIVVQASVEDAFDVFTTEIDSWWPRTHHIGKVPMRRIIIEPRVGGRCYSEQVDDSECDWGQVLVWEPPRRLVFAWQITHEWGYEPDLSRSSEVEVRFARVGPESTRVELEHRHFDRQGRGGDAMRTAVDSPDGWNGVLSLFEQRINARRQERSR